MDRETALTILRGHADELREAGVAHLRLFGSTARGEASDTSDVDLLADFETSMGLFELEALRRRLSELLGANVDLTRESWLKERIRARVVHEAVRAF